MMRNSGLSSGVNFMTIVPPKAKEVVTGNSQSKECAGCDFQAMLQTACGERERSANQVSDGKPLNVKPGLGQGQAVKGRKPNANAGKTATSSLVDASKDELIAGEAQFVAPTAEQVAAQGISAEPLNITPTQTEENLTEDALQSDLVPAGAVNQALVPIPAPTLLSASSPNPELTGFQSSLIAGRFDPTLPDNSAGGNVPKPELTIADSTSNQPATKGTVPAVLPEITAFGAAGTTPSSVVPVLPETANDALTQAQIATGPAGPQTGAILSQPGIQAGAATAVFAGGNVLPSLSGVEAGQSRVALEPEVAMQVASGQPFNLNAAAEKMILPSIDTQPAQPVASIQMVNNGAAPNGIDLAAPSMPDVSNTGTNQAASAVMPDLNGTVNFKTVMAGMSLQKTGLEAGKASVVSSVPLAASMDMLINVGNRLINSNQAADPGDRATVPSGVIPVETLTQEADTATGLGQINAGKTVKLNSDEGVNNLQSAPLPQTPKEMVEVNTNAVASGKAAVAEKAPVQTATLEERETIARTGQTASELSGTAVVTAHDKVVQTNQTVNQPQVSAANKDELFNQIVEQAKVMIHQGQSEMEISLKPDHLGKLKMKIAVEHQVVTAQFIVESEQVKQIIETNLVQLRKLLQEAGARVENLTVSLGQNNSDANLAQQSHSGNSGKPAQSQSTSWTNAKEMPNRPDENRVAVKSSTLVDLIA